MNSFWMQFRLSKVTNSGFTEKNYTGLTRDMPGKLRNKKLRKQKTQDEVTGHLISTRRTYFCAKAKKPV